MSKKRTFCIVDGHAQIYAAYYAPQVAGLTSPTGEPTRASYIFATMLLKLLREQQPDRIAVAMDARGPTFRHEMYEKYKATRPPMPEDLPVQIERIGQIVRAMNIDIYIKEGYEADDLIGTLSRHAVKEGYEVLICSRDKDLEQLIGPDVKMLNPRDGAVTDAAALLEKKGITPEQVIDILALSGDVSDNIPGVPDVGSKTALQWIQKYGTLDNLIARADEITGKRGQSLRDNIETVQLARRLVTLNCDVPIEMDWQADTVREPDNQALAALFQELGFQRLLAELPGDPAETEISSLSGARRSDYQSLQLHLVDTPEKLEAFCGELQEQKVFAIDTETTALNPMHAELVGISISWQAGVGYYLPLKTPLGQSHLEFGTVQEKLGGILADPAVPKCGQNIKYDLIVLRNAGLPLQGIHFDTLIASFLQDPSRTQHNMDALARDHLGYDTIKLSELIGKGKKQITFDMVEPQQAADYAAEDAEVTWRLYQTFKDRFTDRQLAELFDKVEMPLVLALAEMEYRGIALNVSWLKTLGLRMSDRMDTLTQEIHKEAGRPFNVDSPKQLAEVLFGDLGLVPVKKGKTGPSTDQDVLETLASQHPVPALMLEYRQISKLKNTYVDKLPSMICPRTGRLHTSFSQTIAATGRLSSSDPNLQNIPIRSELGQEIRRAFVAGKKDYVLLAADYSQIELRMLAHFSKDTVLQKAFADGLDIHNFVAAQVYDVAPEAVDAEQRRKAKAVNFGIIYGQTPFGLSRSIGIEVSAAKEFIDAYFARYPKIRKFIDNVIAQAKKDGHVRTILGRRRDLPEINSRSVPQQRLAERMAVNTVIQGSAADLIKIAMINLHRRIQLENLDLKMLLQVHDELVFELPESRAAEYAKIIQTEMSEAILLDVPIEAQTAWADNWMDCK